MYLFRIPTSVIYIRNIPERPSISSYWKPVCKKPNRFYWTLTEKSATSLSPWDTQTKIILQKYLHHTSELLPVTLEIVTTEKRIKIYMQIFYNLKMLYNNLSYQKKLLYSYLLLVFLPLTILSVYFYYQTSAITTKNIDNLSFLNLDYTSNRLSETFSEMSRIAKDVTVSESIHISLDKTPPDNILEHSEDFETILASINLLDYDSNIYSVRIFVNPELPYANNKPFIWSLAQITDNFPCIEEDVRKNAALYGPLVVQSSSVRSRDVFSFTMPMRSLSDYSQTIAVVCVDVSLEHLISLMKVADYSQRGTVFLTDTAGTPLIGYSNALNEMISIDNLTSFPVTQGEKQEWQQNQQIHISPLIMNNYYLVVSTPHEHQLLKQQLYQLLFIGLFLSIIIYFSASLYARFNSKRITHLSIISKEIQQGNLDVHCIVDSSDEIGELQLTFNSMVNSIQQMMKDQYQLGCHLKNQELQLLQAQIDPHFLYNTLDLVTWTVRNRSADEVCDIILMLSQYYRISLSKGKDIIPLEKEIEHVTLYVKLQNKRFENKIQLITTICPEAYALQIPKLILQPLVENSITHGFKGGEETISIDISKTQTHYCITVSDDGIGMSLTTLSRLRLKMTMSGSDDANGGYGLINIQERIQNYYGANSFIEFDSTLQKGTIVKIFLPVST